VRPFFCFGWMGYASGEAEKKTATVIKRPGGFLILDGWMSLLTLQNHLLGGLRNAISDELYHVNTG
jgi:hypothetical protein